jgi:hypothetical protein
MRYALRLNSEQCLSFRATVAKRMSVWTSENLNPSSSTKSYAACLQGPVLYIGTRYKIIPGWISLVLTECDMKTRLKKTSARDAFGLYSHQLITSSLDSYHTFSSAVSYGPPATLPSLRVNSRFATSFVTVPYIKQRCRPCIRLPCYTYH